MNKLKGYKPNKLKWDKSSLIETDLYIKLYVESLNKLLAPQDKQTLFVISKFFTDGAAEIGRGQFALADYYFLEGEKYFANVENTLLQQVITNVYDRSKSLYFFAKGNSKKAIELIDNTLKNNLRLEKIGFGFLVFDRVSQYHNLSRVYFSTGKRELAMDLLAGITCFLIQGNSDLLPDLNENYIDEYGNDLSKMKHFMLCQLLFETTGHLQKIEDKGLFVLESRRYFTKVIDSANNYLVFLPEDILLKKWILCLDQFYLGNYKKFIKEATNFLQKEPIFYNGLPGNYMTRFLEYANV